MTTKKIYQQCQRSEILKCSIERWTIRGGEGGGTSDGCSLSDVLFSFNDVSYPDSEDSKFENNHIALGM